MSRSKFNLSHYHLLTGEVGQLLPIGCVEALPGDTIQHNSSVLARVSPLAAPVMHPVTARVHHFFVPNRVLWPESENGGWEQFITGGPDGMNAESPPTLETTGEEADLLDYLGLPRTSGIAVNALPVRAFNMIFNEYYRDQDLVEERELDDLTIPRIAWEKDYFTSARPWSQKGPDVTIPIGATAPVRSNGLTPTANAGPDNNRSISITTNSTNPSGALNFSTRNGTSNDLMTWGDETGLEADLAQAIGGNINDVRRAFAIQRYQEARARYGSRYTEYLRYLGVTPRDARLQRPEYLGGGRSQLNFSEVLQTAPETNAGGPSTEFGVGDLYGHGIAALRSNKYRRFIEEHGYIISLLSVRPKSMYNNGIHRTWLRRHKEDYFQKELQHIGQQEVFNNEVYADPDDGDQTFGYQDRYHEYREQPSRISGEFRDILNYWHMGRDFESAPVLNGSFVTCDATKRIHNEQSQHALWVMVQHKMVARRLLSRNAAARLF